MRGGRGFGRLVEAFYSLNYITRYCSLQTAKERFVDKCLVTGGAGFIGSHLVDRLVAIGHPVRVLDNLTTGNLNNLAAVRERIEFVKGSITDPQIVPTAIKDCQIVFHLAALPSVVQSIEDPLASHEIGATGTLRVLDAARRAEIGRAHV